jgi:hypothetical protein
LDAAKNKVTRRRDACTALPRASPTMRRIMFPVCPKCRHSLETPSGATGCPACGLVFAKYVAAERGAPVREEPDLTAHERDPLDTPLERLLWVPERVESWQVYARAAMFVLIAFWGWRIAAMDIRDGEIAASFMHNINLAFHEAGHIVFMAFGEFLTIAGGTLFQLLVPIVIGVALHWKNRDNFGASLALWWLATSFMDCAPYAWDALHPQLVLLNGHTGEEGGHDWIYLLGETGLLQQAHAVGRALHVVGIVLMAVANLWAAVILYRQFRNRTDQPTLD